MFISVIFDLAGGSSHGLRKKTAMILYHFTAIELLNAILHEGLRKGDLPLTAQLGEQAVWFTTDHTGDGHGLSEAGRVSEMELADARALTNTSIPKGAEVHYIDKRKVRIKVIIPSRDRKLIEWLPFARRKLEPKWLDALHKTGGGEAKAATWWFYRGIIRTSEFKEIFIRRHDGSYTQMTEEDSIEAAACAARGLIGEDVHGLGAPLDLDTKTLQRVDRV